MKLATASHTDMPPRELSTRLDMPIWDSSLPIDGQKLDNQLDKLFEMPSIRESGDFNRQVLHEVTAGWTKRFDDLEALRGAIIAVAPNRARALTDAVKVGRDNLAVLQAADKPRSSRAKLEAADTALNVTHYAIGDVRWGVPSDIRDGHFITPGDVARSRVQQFDGDGDSRIDAEEFEHVRTANEMVFDNPRTFQQTFNAYRLFKTADDQGATDGFTTVSELEAMLTRWDGDGDGWMTNKEFENFAENGDATITEQHPVKRTF